MEKTELYKQTAERIKTAKRVGVAMAPIAKHAGINPFRLTCIAKFGMPESSSYRHQSALTDEECKLINKQIDDIKAAL